MLTLSTDTMWRNMALMLSASSSASFHSSTEHRVHVNYNFTVRSIPLYQDSGVFDDHPPPYRNSISNASPKKPGPVTYWIAVDENGSAKK